MHRRPNAAGVSPRAASLPTLFGDPEERVVKASTETIGKYFNNRLKSIFAAVADEPKVLRNSGNSPLYFVVLRCR
jgi:hypothetical protein